MTETSTTRERVSDDFDVAVVGAGIAGLVCATALGQAGFSVLLLDANDANQTVASDSKRTHVKDYPNRVSAITPANASFLNSLNIWSDLSEYSCCPYQKMHVWEQLGSGSIQFNALDYQRSALGYIVENQALEQAAIQQLVQCEKVRWEKHAALVSCHFDHSTQTAVLDSQESSFVARLVVAADGANSSIRRFMGFQTREWDYEQKAIVCTVQTELPHDSVARQRFSERGPVALLPLQDSYSKQDKQKDCFSSLVWSIDNASFDQIMSLDDDSFCHALEQEMEGDLGRVVSVSKRQAFPLRQRQAKQYVKDNVVLVADAAHTIHPLAGQGLNLGLSDIKTLCECLMKYREWPTTINHPVVLKRYQRERQLDNMAMAAAMEGFKRLFGSSNPLIRLIRNQGVNLVNEHTFIKRRIAEQAMGLS